MKKKIFSFPLVKWRRNKWKTLDSLVIGCGQRYPNGNSSIAAVLLTFYFETIIRKIKMLDDGHRVKGILSRIGYVRKMSFRLRWNNKSKLIGLIIKFLLCNLNKMQLSVDPLPTIQVVQMEGATVQIFLHYFKCLRWHLNEEDLSEFYV